MSSLTIKDQKSTNIHTPNQFISDIRQYFTKAPEQARQIYLDETPDFEYQSKKFQVDSNDVKVISHSSVTPPESVKWKSYPFKIIYLVGSFLYKAKTSTASYRFRLLDERIFSIINDLSSDFNYYQKRRMFKNLSVLFENLSPLTLKVFQPDDLIKVIIDALLALITAFILIYVPIQISFKESDLLQNKYFDFTPLIMVIVEVTIKLNSAFYLDGVVIQSRRQITIQYLKNEVFFDICYIFSFLMSLSGFQYLQLIILLRIKRLKQYIERIEDITFIREKYAASIDLIKLIFFLFYINHNGACLWNFIGELISQTENWIHYYNVLDASFYSRYMRSFYWCVITTTTVGYGDLVPTNDLERFVSCLIIISGQIAFGYSISSIGEIFKQIYEKTNTYKTQMSKVTYYLKQKNFDKQLQMKIIRQFQYLYSQKYKTDHNEIEDLITQLIPEMAAEVKTAMYLPILQKNLTFRTKFSSEFLNDLSQIMITKSYNNGQLILDTDQNVSQLIFIVEGSLAVTAQYNYLRSYKSGYVVGLKNFIIQQPVVCSYKAETSCTLYLLPYEEFMNLLRKYQQDMENFQMLKEDIIFKQYHKQIGEVCEICKSNHNLQKCPFPIYQFNRNKLIRNQLQKQKRVFQQRRDNKMMGYRQALQDYQLYAINAIIYITNFKEEDIDVSYQAKLGLRPWKLSLNIPTGSNILQGQSLHNSSFKEISSKLQPRSFKEISSKLQPKSQVFDHELSSKDNIISNLQAHSILTAIQHTSFIKKAPSILYQRLDTSFQSKELDQELKFSQLEQIQQEEYLCLQHKTLNLDKYADFKFYNQGNNLDYILNQFIEIKFKKIFRPDSSNRSFWKSPSVIQRSKYKKLQSLTQRMPKTDILD